MKIRPNLKITYLSCYEVYNISDNFTMNFIDNLGFKPPKEISEVLDKDYKYEYEAVEAIIYLGYYLDTKLRQKKLNSILM